MGGISASIFWEIIRPYELSRTLKQLIKVRTYQVIKIGLQRLKRKSWRIVHNFLHVVKILLVDVEGEGIETLRGWSSCQNFCQREQILKYIHFRPSFPWLDMPLFLFFCIFDRFMIIFLTNGWYPLRLYCVSNKYSQSSRRIKVVESMFKCLVGNVPQQHSRLVYP